MTRTPPLARRAVAVALASAACCCLGFIVFFRVGVSSWSAASSPGVAKPGDILLVIVAVLGALLTAWLAIATSLAALAQVPGAIGTACSYLAARVTPAIVARVVALAVGSAMVTAGAPASASPFSTVSAGGCPAVVTVDRTPDPAFRPLAEPTPGTGSLASAPEPAFVPLAPSSPVPTATSIDSLEHTPRQLPEAGETHVVRRGDTLWDIAAARLGPGATPADIAAAWPRWYAANRRLIGPDPSHIVPGQRLIPPRIGPMDGSPAAVLIAPGASR